MRQGDPPLSNVRERGLLPSPRGPMACPYCRCLLVARSTVVPRGLVCADCGQPVPRAKAPLSPGRLLALLCTGALLVVAGAMSLTMALLEDHQLRPEAPAPEAFTVPRQPSPWGTPS
jgi:hypothetical protein